MDMFYEYQHMKFCWANHILTFKLYTFGLFLGALNTIASTYQKKIIAFR